MSTENNIEELQAQLQLAKSILQKQKMNREKYKQTDKGKIAVKNAKNKYRNKTKTLFFKCVECDCMIKLSTKSYHYNRSRKHKKTLAPPNTPQEEKTE